MLHSGFHAATSTAFLQNYEYEALGQLTKWIKSLGTESEISETYTYDSVGNRLALTWKNNLDPDGELAEI